MTRKNKYIEALQHALDKVDAAPAFKSHRTREEVESDIAVISERLKGPLNNVERIWLVADRRELQNELKALAVQP